MDAAQLTALFQQQVLIFDGAMGTELYRRHIFTNRCFEELCLSESKLVSAIHHDYALAGADVLTTNSFGANIPALRKHGLADKCSDINRRAAQLAREEADSHSDRKILVAGAIGPFGSPKHRIGGGLQITAQQRSEMQAQQAKALLEGGADFIIFETLPGATNAIAARRAMALLPPNTPFILSFALDSNSNLQQMAEARIASAWDNPEGEELPRPTAIGLNCGLGPEMMLEAVEIVKRLTHLPIVVQPNAGLPHKVEHRSLYLCSPEYLTTYAVRYVNQGVRGIGGCCGTTPDHIADLARSVKPLGRLNAATVAITPAKSQEPAKAQLPPAMPLAQRSAFGAKLAAGEWVTTLEIAPPRGWDMSKVLDKARICRDAGIDVINIPDGPRAAPRISAMAAAVRIQNEVQQPVVLHVCARDRNYIGLQGDLLGCASLGINNLLFITGDPPKLGNYTFATGVFDTDSVGLVRLQDRLNRGIDLAEQSVNPPTAAVIGVGADPSAIDFQREVQHLRNKVAAGANYVATQPVFDAQAFLRFADAIADLKLPIIAGVWPLASLKNALFMKNEVPGVVVPDQVIQRMEAAGTQEEQLNVGIEIAREIIQQIRHRCAGVQVSAPLGNIQAALRTIQ